MVARIMIRENPPFKRGDVVVCDLAYLTVKSGDRVRILDCKSAIHECESGWLVSATNRLRGRIATSPVVAIEGVDSGWFRKVKQ